MKENIAEPPKFSDKEQIPTTFCDEALFETELSKLRGFDDCERCFFRTFFIEHVTKGALQLRGKWY